MNQHIIQGYAAAAAELIPRYAAVSSSDLYAPVLHLLPGEAGRMLDIGAGVGRDAAWFAGKGHDVLAVEPVAEFRDAGASRHRSSQIEWADDVLPSLSHVLARDETFDLVLLNAVWQHLDVEHRRIAMRNVCGLTAIGGLLIISVRHGPGAPTRPCFEASAQETIALAHANGFQLTFSEERESVQAQNRAAGVRWTWLAFKLVGPKPQSA